MIFEFCDWMYFVISVYTLFCVFFFCLVILVVFHYYSVTIPVFTYCINKRCISSVCMQRICRCYFTFILYYYCFCICWCFGIVWCFEFCDLLWCWYSLFFFSIVCFICVYVIHVVIFRMPRMYANSIHDTSKLL